MAELSEGPSGDEEAADPPLTDAEIDSIAEAAFQKSMPEARALAERLHEAYERMAPAFGYETREESRKAWPEVPIRNRALMVISVADVIDKLGLREEVGLALRRRDSALVVD